MDEVWIVPVPGYPSYGVTNAGHIWNIKLRKRLYGSSDGTGRLRASLFRDKKHRNLYIHRIVAKAFLDDYTEEHVVDFIDGDRHNTAAWNLFMSDELVKRKKNG